MTHNNNGAVSPTLWDAAKTHDREFTQAQLVGRLKYWK